MCLYISGALATDLLDQQILFHSQRNGNDSLHRFSINVDIKELRGSPQSNPAKNSARNHSENHVRIVIEPTIEQTNMMYTFIVHSANHYRIALSAMRKIDRPCIRASWTHRRILNPSQIVSRHQLNHRVHYSYTVPQWRTNDFLFYL